MYSVSALCVTNLALWLQETNMATSDNIKKTWQKIF